MPIQRNRKLIIFLCLGVEGSCDQQVTWRLPEIPGNWDTLGLSEISAKVTEELPYPSELRPSQGRMIFLPFLRTLLLSLSSLHVDTQVEVLREDPEKWE